MKAKFERPLFRQSALALGIASVMMLSALPTSAPQAKAKVRNAEDLMVVDCLLPGQVRKLGAMASFMTARRPIRTTQSDCEIRGGEYVAFDRANYQTALKVWMQQAETGDAEAQNYVGEIYAKGLGIEPDYVQAAAWYQKAAAQGLTRAKINLGFLYEEGLGVEKDPQKALNLYREGSGITGDELIFTSTMAAAIGEKDKQISGLQQNLEAEKAANDKLRSQLDSAKKEIESRRQTMQMQQSELESAKAQLTEAQQRIAPQSPDIALISQALAQAEERLTAERAALEKERGDYSSQRQNDQLQLAKLRAQEADLGKRGATDPAAKAELDKVRQTLSDLTLKLDSSSQRAAELEKLLKTNSERMTQETLRYEGDRKKMELALAASKEDRELLLLLEQQLSEKQREVSRQRGTITALERQVQVGSDSLAGGGNVLAGGPVVEILEPAITLTRGKPAAISRRKEGSEIVGRVVSKTPVSEVSINGQMVKVAPNGMFRAQVAVPESGAPIQVAATDKAGGKASLEFTLMPAANATAQSSVGTRKLPAGVKRGKQYAILIGNNEYGQYPALQSAINDANQIGGVLKARYGFQTTVLNNASRFDILSAFNDAREQLKPEDSLLVYFAGHGEVDSASKQGYWVPVDGQSGNAKSWLSNRAISDILNTVEARHIMVVADSCYSGAMTRSSLPTINPGAADSAWSDWITKVSSSRSRTALTSGGLQPVADTGRGQNSYFATAVLGALEANSNVLEGQNLFRGVASSMALAAVESSIVQVPEYAPIQFAGHEAGEFLFVPRGGLADASDSKSEEVLVDADPALPKAAPVVAIR